MWRKLSIFLYFIADLICSQILLLRKGKKSLILLLWVIPSSFSLNQFFSKEIDKCFKVFSPSFSGLRKTVLTLGNREGSIHAWLTGYAQLFFFGWGIHLDSFWVAKSDVIALFYLLWWWSLMGVILVLFVCVVKCNDSFSLGWLSFPWWLWPSFSSCWQWFPWFWLNLQFAHFLRQTLYEPSATDFLIFFLQ